MPDGTEAKVRARCARMGFSGSKADTPVSALSGGEKARLLMGLATFGGPHLLILDEPTNHLDIDSRSALMEAINDYGGAVILISHDRFLLEACADRLWLVANGSVKPFDDDLDAYRKFVLEGPDRPATRREDDRASAADTRREAAGKRVALAPLRKKIEALEAKMARFTELIARVDAVLGDPDTFQKEPLKASQLSAQRSDLERSLMAAEEEWLALSEEYETAAAG
jgi:ATP-binding cassette subfamily F protein 3